jgi:hypothetical protein
MSKHERSADGKQQFNVYLPPALIKRLKHHCIERGGSLSALVEHILSDYLDKQLPRGKENKR